MKKIALTGCLALSGLAAVAQNSQTFVHVSSVANSSVNTTKLDHQALNLKPGGSYLYTHNFSARGPNGQYLNHKTGWYYSGSNWYIFNQDKVKMDTGVSFNVFVPGTGVQAWLYTADSAKIAGNTAYIDHVSINGDTNAMVFVNDVWNPEGVKSAYNTNTIGVYFNKVNKKWTIYNQAFLTPMVKGSSYNIIVPTPASGITTFVHTSTKTNVSLNQTRIDHPDANNNPNAHVFVTQRWNHREGTGKYNNHEVGVYYNGSRWTIYNQDQIKMDTGVHFNVMIIPNNTASITSQKMSPTMNLFPNPVSNGEDLEISLNNPSIGTCQVTVMNVITGQIVYDQEHIKTGSDFNTRLNIAAFNKGVYLITVAGNQFIERKRFIVN